MQYWFTLYNYNHLRFQLFFSQSALLAFHIPDTRKSEVERNSSLQHTLSPFLKQVSPIQVQVRLRTDNSSTLLPVKADF